jgi:hypothetical protein
MKPLDRGPELRGENRLLAKPLPLEWMDPMSWRLPSGKTLAEFALQAGFLAPLLMSGSMGDGRVKRKKKEAPVVPGRFRRNSISHTRQG